MKSSFRDKLLGRERTMDEKLKRGIMLLISINVLLHSLVSLVLTLVTSYLGLYVLFWLAAATGLVGFVLLYVLGVWVDGIKPEFRQYSSPIDEGNAQSMLGRVIEMGGCRYRAISASGNTVVWSRLNADDGQGS